MSQGQEERSLLKLSGLCEAYVVFDHREDIAAAAQRSDFAISSSGTMGGNNSHPSSSGFIPGGDYSQQKAVNEAPSGRCS